MYVLNDSLLFPDLRKTKKHGPIAIGGDLSTERLILAYQKGIFPWYNQGEIIKWHSPDPRMVLFPENLIVSKSMKQVIKKSIFNITYDKDFESVIIACSKIKRYGQFGTWITNDMINAYLELHKEGYAHSVEVWSYNKLVGGLYGISLGKCFFGESMFSVVSNASKTAFITLVNHLKEKGFWLIDCQMHTDHLASLGADLITRDLFLDYMDKNLTESSLVGDWGNLF